MYALELQGFKCPQNKNVRKTQEFKAEYQRQLTKFRQEQAAEKGSQTRSTASRTAGTGCGRKRTIIHLHNPNWERICT